MQTRLLWFHIHLRLHISSYTYEVYTYCDLMCLHAYVCTSITCRDFMYMCTSTTYYDFMYICTSITYHDFYVHFFRKYKLYHMFSVASPFLSQEDTTIMIFYNNQLNSCLYSRPLTYFLIYKQMSFAYYLQNSDK